MDQQYSSNIIEVRVAYNLIVNKILDESEGVRESALTTNETTILKIKETVYLNFLFDSFMKCQSCQIHFT